jgi:hypothetical protein
MSAREYQCGDTVVEAMQWPEGDSYSDVCKRAAIHRWVWDNDGHTWVTFAKANPDDVFVALETLEGNVRVDAGDWILRGVLNVFYRQDAETFAADFWPVGGEQ